MEKNRRKEKAKELRQPFGTNCKRQFAFTTNASWLRKGWSEMTGRMETWREGLLKRENKKHADEGVNKGGSGAESGARGKTRGTAQKKEKRLLDDETARSDAHDAVTRSQRRPTPDQGFHSALP